MSGQNYRDLIAWRTAMDLVEAIYKVSLGFPKEEVYGLIAQIRRAVVSIPSNIAEGQGRGSNKEFQRFLHIAHGSLREVETQLAIAVRLGFVTADDVRTADSLCEQAGRVINGLLRHLNQN